MNKIKWFLIWCIDNERNYDNAFEIISYEWCDDFSLRVYQKDGQYNEKDYPSKRLTKEEMGTLIEILLKLGYEIK